MAGMRGWDLLLSAIELLLTLGTGRQIIMFSQCAIQGIYSLKTLNKVGFVVASRVQSKSKVGPKLS